MGQRTEVEGCKLEILRNPKGELYGIVVTLVDQDDFKASLFVENLPQQAEKGLASVWVHLGELYMSYENYLENQAQIRIKVPTSDYFELKSMLHPSSNGGWKFEPLAGGEKGFRYIATSRMPA